MKPDQRFAVGDRVRLIAPLEGMPSRHIGTVQQVFWDADLYTVSNGGDGAPLIVHYHDLELALPALDERNVGGANGK